MHQRLVESYYQDQADWAIDIGFSEEGWKNIQVNDVAPGWSIEVDGCSISAGAVVHPPMEAVAYKFSYGGRSLVISGDTAACDELESFAQSADLLIVDACAAPPSSAESPKRRRLIERLHEFHASPQECVDMARRGDVGHVVLTHHLPEAFPRWELNGYDGQVSIGGDLTTFVA